MRGRWTVKQVNGFISVLAWIRTATKFTARVMEFPEDFNQLELLNTHGHLIPRGVSSLWTGSKDEEEEVEEEEDHGEEWYLGKEEALKDTPKELMLWAAENNRLSTVHSLLITDPSLVHCCDEDGYTPLHRAAYGGHVEVVSALLASGSEVDPRTIDGWTPLHSACRWSRVTVASCLLQRGAELNAQTNGGLTPLHLAASYTSSSKTDSAQTLELLLSQRHLKPGLCSSSGETAGDVARRSGPHHFLFEMVEDCVNVASVS
ncbi:ankyrin repeat domain-containing protein 49 isoform X2 [Stegastes partitus]|uniref:Ankyrin repeat domain-containing protein 49 isoform X2 n=2 Tax=Stegastes partitus TaxID=144197 RepID=A0A9Y4K005_9TELE|nr:PREDICTED: ankyrin repeat domain-containing protein 49 isoform X2 [Stegastes partitus]